MAFKLVDRVRESTISPGTGTATLAGAALGYQTFSAGVGANNTTYYVIADQSGANWEVGYGTVGAGGTTLARTTVLSSSNAGSLVNFASGTQDVWVDYTATKAVFQDINGLVTVPTFATSSTTSTTPVLSFNASNTSFASGATVSGSYLQFLLQNKSGTAGASTNYVLSNDLGTDSTYYGEFGMNSSIFSATTPSDFFSINNGIYFSGHDGDLSIGSGNGFKTYLAWGTTGQSAHVINASGALGFSTNLGTTPALSGTTGYGTSGQVLTSGGSAAAPTWTTPTTGTVTSVSATVPAFLSVTGSPITTSGTLAFSYSGTALPIANGGTGATTAAGANANLQGYTTTATAAGTTALTNTSTYYQYFTGATTQTITLPLNTTIQNGWSFHIANNSTGNLTVNSNSGALVLTILPQTTGHITCIDATVNTAAAWDGGFTDFGSVTGTGANVLTTSPTLVTPILGTPSSGTLTNCTGLLATGGGTGQSTYAIGDLLQGGATNTLTKLAAVATGNALISGGVTTASSWGKIGLTTHISGILAGANGGTGVANTGFTFTMAGNVSHAGAFTQTFTATANTSLTLPASGTVISSVTSPATNPISGTPSASTYLRGDGTWATFTTGTVTSVAALTLGTTGTDLSSTVATGTTTPVITLNVPTASATNRGALSAADWTTFNNKQPAGSYLTTAVTSAVAGTGISVSAATGAVTFTNTGVTSVTAGTGISVSASTGGITISNTAPSLGATYLVVAGGGGGGSQISGDYCPGGGGAGGMVSGTALLASGIVYTATVGGGGAGGAAGGRNNGVQGTASSISGGSLSVSTIGGGYGAQSGGGPGNNPVQGGSGGSGGGSNGSSPGTSSGGIGTTGQGNNGGTDPTGVGGPGYGGSGGGGAGGVGGNGTSSISGAGGVGLQSSITGSSIYYAGGGGGGNYSSSLAPGGSGGGGNGGTVSSNPTAGTANLGGGGGGAGNNGNTGGGNGGSGVVIISIPTSVYTGTVTGSPTVTTSGAFTIIKFTSSGTYTA